MLLCMEKEVVSSRDSDFIWALLHGTGREFYQCWKAQAQNVPAWGQKTGKRGNFRIVSFNENWESVEDGH